MLRRGNGGDPGTLDPVLAEDVHAFAVLTDLYEGLVTIDASGRPVPGVAESWTVSDDGLTYRFLLRDEARWSDGDPVVADDFVRAFRRSSNVDSTSAYSFLLAPLRNHAAVRAGEAPIESLGIRATGDRQLDITLEKPTSYLLTLLTMPIAMPEHRDALSSDAYSNERAFVGNGPYRLVSRQVGGPIRLRTNESYWDSAAVNISEIIYYPVEDEVAELNMFRAGELDITNSVPASHVNVMRGANPGETRISPTLALYYLAFDLTEPPLDRRNLRKALSMAIDRDQLVEIIGRGEQPAYNVVPPGTAGYRGPQPEWLSLPYEDRVLKARDLLAVEGYSDANPLRLTYLYDAGGIHEQVALAIGSMWRAALDIQVEYDKREWQYFLDTRSRREEWQVMRFSWFGDYDDPTTFLDVFRSDSPQNLPGIVNPAYDSLLDTAGRSIDESVRYRQIADAESLLLEDFAIAPLYFYVAKHMVRASVRGFEDNVIDRHPSRYLYFAAPGP